MFAQSVLDKIKESASEYALARSKSLNKNIPLCDVVYNLIGYKCCENDFEETHSLDQLLLLVSKNVQGSKSKARKNSTLYNSNRHIALINLYERLQKKREMLNFAL